MAGTAIIFEFKHYKPKKKKVSTKAWAFMELSEFVGDCDQSKKCLEMYDSITRLLLASVLHALARVLWCWAYGGSIFFAF